MRSERVGVVYVIRHPDTRAPVYVGQTVLTPERRLRSHVSTAKWSKTPLSVWIRELGRPPIIETALVGLTSRLSMLEAVVMRALRSDGHALLNVRHACGTVDVNRRRRTRTKREMAMRQPPHPAPT